MLAIISPAKSLDFDTPSVTKIHTQPAFLKEAKTINQALKKLSPADLSDLMSISPKLGELNFHRNQQWQPPFDEKNAKQAVLAFTGDVYQGLDAPSLSEKELDDLERQVWHNLLERAAEDCEREQKHRPEASLEPLTRLWDELPRFVRRDEYTIRDYARLLARLGDEAQAETLLRKVLRNHWSDELINLYGRLKGDQPDEQLLVAEQWLKERPNNPELLLALGRLSLRNELWGKAKGYFKTSLQLKRSREALAELSRLNAHMGEEETSIKLLMQGLETDNGLPELPMPKA